MSLYPKVLSEMKTMRLVAAGASIARYGDGELKMVNRPVGIKSQEANRALSTRLEAILEDSGDCLVGIPNIRDVEASPITSQQKKEFWGGHHWAAGLLSARSYVSSFISRPDSAPWIDTDAYWALVESLWRGHDVTVVGGSGKSLKPEDLTGAKTITHIQCRKQHAFQDYDEILERIGTPKRALICLGPTATLLAVDLCRKGVHAIDLGHLGIFIRKRRRGDPMVVADDDKAHDRLAVA